MNAQPFARIMEYDEKAAARILGVAPRTLRAWRMKGLVGFHRTPTGRVRFTLDQLVDVQRSGRVNPKPSPPAGAGDAPQ